MEWIRTEDQFPESMKYVLCYSLKQPSNKGSRIFMAYWNSHLNAQELSKLWGAYPAKDNPRWIEIKSKFTLSRKS